MPDRELSIAFLIEENPSLLTPSDGGCFSSSSARSFPIGRSSTAQRARPWTVNTQVDNFDAVIASSGSGLLDKI
jgi:hypothetical protein